MRRRIFFMNLLILAGIILSANYLVSAWHSFQQANNLERIVKKQPFPGSVPPRVDVQPMKQSHPFAEFMVLSEKDLFTPERRPSESPPPVVEVPPPPALPMKPSLMGVSTVGGKKRAFVTVYEGKNNQGQAKVVGVGDEVQGYVVSKIADSTMTLKWNDQLVLIDMLDAQRPQQAAVKRLNPVSVITVGSAVAAVQTIKGGAAASEEQRGVQVVGVVGAQAAQALAPNQRGLQQQGGAGSNRRGAAGAARQRGAAAPAGAPQVLQTPFGKFVRRTPANN